MCAADAPLVMMNS